MLHETKLTSGSPAIIRMGPLSRDAVPAVAVVVLDNLLLQLLRPACCCCCCMMRGPAGTKKLSQHVQISPRATTNNETREQAEESIFSASSRFVFDLSRLTAVRSECVPRKRATSTWTVRSEQQQPQQRFGSGVICGQKTCARTKLNSIFFYFRRFAAPCARSPQHCNPSRNHMDPAPFRAVSSLSLVLLVLCTFAAGFLVPRPPTFTRDIVISRTLSSAFFTKLRDGEGGGGNGSNNNRVAAANGVAMSAAIEGGELCMSYKPLLACSYNR